MLVRWFMLPTLRSLLQLSTAGNACAQTKAAEPAPLTSIAIDPTLFREGAITRLAGTRGAWSYDCDEVARLKQRFCSLRTSVKAADGAILAGLTVSTGQDGRPAALLVMAARDITRYGIEIGVPAPASTSQPRGQGAPGVKEAVVAKPKTPAAIRVYPAACTADVCQLVWTLSTEQIAALNSGGGLQLRYVPPIAETMALAVV